MTRFSESMREKAADLLERARNHPLLTPIAEDRLSDERFRFLLGQILLFKREYERFLSCLIAKTPQETRRSFVEAMMDFYWDSDVLEEIIRRAGVDSSKQRMSPPCRSFADYLFTVVTVQTFPEAICAGYGAADSAREFWTHVRRIQPAHFAWSDLVETWSGDTVTTWMASTAKAIDGIAADSSPQVREKMLDSYRIALHYHYRFLDLALEESGS
jgi:thiaminase